MAEWAVRKRLIRPAILLPPRAGSQDAFLNICARGSTRSPQRPKPLARHRARLVARSSFRPGRLEYRYRYRARSSLYSESLPQARIPQKRQRPRAGFLVRHNLPKVPFETTPADWLLESSALYI